MTSRIKESAYLTASIDKIWDLVRPLHFKFSSSVLSVQTVGNPSDVGSERIIEYKDKTIQKVKVVELSDVRTLVTYELVDSTPPVSMLSAIHTIRLRRVTDSNGTLVELVSDFSRDCGDAVIEDSRFKKLDLLKDLKALILKKKEKKLASTRI